MYNLIRKYYLEFIFIIIVFLLINSLLPAQKSKLIIQDIDAPSMENNLYDISSKQTIAVYLPPSYENSNSRYPVVYFLPGYGDQVQYWTNGTYQNFKLQEAMDRLISKGTIKEFIVVIVNGYNFLQGCFYVNSPVTGNCEDFVTKDVVNYIDANYRTIKNPESRGISGHSMGGFGALNQAMRHPDIFGSLYCLSPGLFDLNGVTTCQLFKSQTFIKQIIQKIQDFSNMSQTEALPALKTYIQGRLNSGDWDTPFIFAYGAAFAPNQNTTFPYIDYPYSLSDNQLVVDSTKLKKFIKGFGGLVEKLSTYKNNLNNLHSITIDYGLNDEYRWISAGCKYFTDLLTTENITHDVKTFSGGHQDQVRSRIEGFLLPSFSKVLVFDSTATDVKLNQVTSKDFDIFQNYPNPFNPETTIRYYVPSFIRSLKGKSGNTDISNVTLKLFDMMGREVALLVNEKQMPGAYEVKFNGRNLASGVYLCSLNICEQPAFSKTMKIVLMK